jgi:hypothetical protein
MSIPKLFDFELFSIYNKVDVFRIKGVVFFNVSINNKSRALLKIDRFAGYVYTINFLFILIIYNSQRQTIKIE